MYSHFAFARLFTEEIDDDERQRGDDVRGASALRVDGDGAASVRQRGGQQRASGDESTDDLDEIG